MTRKFFLQEEILSVSVHICADIQTFDNMMGDDGGHLRVGLDKKD